MYRVCYIMLVQLIVHIIFISYHFLTIEITFAVKIRRARVEVIIRVCLHGEAIVSTFRILPNFPKPKRSFDYITVHRANKRGKRLA